MKNKMEKQFQTMQTQGYDLVTKLTTISAELDTDPGQEVDQLVEMLETVGDSNNQELMEAYIQQFESFMETFNLESYIKDCEDQTA